MCVLFTFCQIYVLAKKELSLTHGVLSQCETVIGGYIDLGGLVENQNLEFAPPIAKRQDPWWGYKSGAQSFR